MKEEQSWPGIVELLLYVVAGHLALLALLVVLIAVALAPDLARELLDAALRRIP